MCKDFEPDKHGFCSHYDEENYGDYGTAHYCRISDCLVEYIVDCPMSTTKCENPRLKGE